MFEDFLICLLIQRRDQRSITKVRLDNAAL
jgi:hypothetical protein